MTWRWHHVTDLKDVLRPLIDQPPGDPEPLDHLQERVRRRRRRRRVSLTAAVTSAAAVVAVTVGTLRAGSDDPGQIETAGRGEQELPGEFLDETRLIGEGETDGVAWELRASESEICLVIVGDAECTSVGGEWLSDGVSAIDGHERRVLWGAVRRRMPDRVNGGFREAARIEARFADGEVVETAPVGLDAGFPTVFYVAKISAAIPAQDTFEVVAYDAEGEELTRFGPVSHDFKELKRLRELGKGSEAEVEHRAEELGGPVG
jgi:hypothetical protein